MIRKGQARWVSGSDVRQQIQFINTCSRWLHEAEPSRPDPSLPCFF